MISWLSATTPFTGFWAGNTASWSLDWVQLHHLLIVSPPNPTELSLQCVRTFYCWVFSVEEPIPVVLFFMARPLTSQSFTVCGNHCSCGDCIMSMETARSITYTIQLPQNFRVASLLGFQWYLKRGIWSLYGTCEACGVGYMKPGVWQEEATMGWSPPGDMQGDTELLLLWLQNNAIWLKGFLMALELKLCWIISCWVVNAVHW